MGVGDSKLDFVEVGGALPAVGVGVGGPKSKSEDYV